MDSVDSIKERIKRIIISKGLTSSKFADIIGVQRSGISHILSGRNKPGLDLLNKILVNFTDISGDWLITGEGEIYKNKRSEDTQMTKQLFPDESEEKFTTKVEELDVNREEDAPVYQTKKRTEEKAAVSPELIPSDSAKSVEKLVVFYSDRTFREYSPE